jgi:integrase
VKRKPPVLDKEKLAKLFERAKGTRLFPFVILGAASGCRRGELLALQWTDVDFERGNLSVSKSVEQTKIGLRVKCTKSEEPRDFDIPEWSIEVLKAHRVVQDRDRKMFGATYQDNGLIFCQPGGGYYSPDRVGARVSELMRKAGLEGVSLHSLRHSTASLLLSKGVPLSVVSEQLRHANQNITLSIYSHAIPSDKRAAAKIWNDSMADVIESTRKAGPSGMFANVCTAQGENWKLLKRLDKIWRGRRGSNPRPPT